MHHYKTNNHICKTYISYRYFIQGLNVFPQYINTLVMVENYSCFYLAVVKNKKALLNKITSYINYNNFITGLHAFCHFKDCQLDSDSNFIVIVIVSL